MKATKKDIENINKMLVERDKQKELDQEYRKAKFQFDHPKLYKIITMFKAMFKKTQNKTSMLDKIKL